MRYLSGPILLLSLFFGFSANAQSSGGNVVVLPIAAYMGDQGLGVGGEFLWHGIGGSDWSWRNGLFYGFNYKTSMLMSSITNRKLIDVFYFSASIMSINSKRNLFYGFENNSSLENPSQFSQVTLRYDVKLGINVYENTVIGAGYGNNETSIGRGERAEEVQFLDRYVDRPFPTGATIKTLQLFAMYDSQEPELAPSAGTKAQILYEQNASKGAGEPEHQHLLISAAHIFQLTGEDLLLLARTRHERAWGGDTPFYAQARLGGSNTLRGYKGGRWTDSASILYGTELRWAFVKTSGWFQRWELNFAFETGRVYNNGAVNVLWDQLRPTYVVGLSPVLTQGVPIRLDVAWSPEGTHSYFHLLYPF